MSMSNERIRYLQQIPVFAMRKMVNDNFPGREGETRLATRIRSALNRKPRRVRQAVMRLTRHELTLLINACPEIDNDEIAACFEQYRYGSNPSFYIYLFDPAQLAAERLIDFDRSLAQALEDDNARFAAEVSQGLPPLRDVLLNDFGSLTDVHGLYEGTYRFLSRMDYIDAEENAISSYETLYGFFWISVTEGYVTIHARKPQVLNSLKSSIEEAAGVLLTHLIISKQFKNALKFLDPKRFRSGRLYEPDPEAERFRSLTIADRRAYAKGYATYEDSYPELRSTSYRISVADKETTIKLTCNRGALSLSGRLEASQFRAWAIDSLAEIIRVLKALRPKPADYVQTYGLRDAPALVAYPGALQKDLVLDLLAQVLTLKQTGKEAATLQLTADKLAVALKGDLAAQIPCVCTEEECGEESYLLCPVCEEPFFSLLERDGELKVACLKRAQHWQAVMPTDVTLDCGHSGTIDASTLRDDLELLPGARLLAVIAQLVNNHLSGYQFDTQKEGFYIQGSVLRYYDDKDAWLTVLPKGGGKEVHVYRVLQFIKENYGDVRGVVMSQ